METVIAVSLLIVAVAVSVVAVFVVRTLIQMRLTARSVEILAGNLNREVEKLQSVTDAAASVAGFFGGTVGKSAAVVFSLIKNFISGWGKEKTGPVGGSPDEGRE